MTFRPSKISFSFFPSFLTCKWIARSGSGAYCSGMSSKNYNSFPEAPEVLVDKQGKVHLIRARQALEQVYQNEIDVDDKIF